ncbi:unnamed protein product [Victoria cruziana]
MISITLGPHQPPCYVVFERSTGRTDVPDLFPDDNRPPESRTHPSAEFRVRPCFFPRSADREREEGPAGPAPRGRGSGGLSVHHERLTCSLLLAMADVVHAADGGGVDRPDEKGSVLFPCEGGKKRWTSSVLALSGGKEREKERERRRRFRRLPLYKCLNAFFVVRPVLGDTSSAEGQRGISGCGRGVPGFTFSSFLPRLLRLGG